MNQLIPNSLSAETNSSVYQGLKIHHFANASYRIPLKKIGITPSASLLYTAHVPLNIYGGIILDYNRLFLVSAAYRNEGDLIFGVGFTLLKILRFSYTYDFPVDDLLTATSGSHELLIKFMLNPKNRSNGLNKLNELLTAIIIRWPDVEFMSSVELGNLMNT